jgi:hypothetical protein
MEDPDQDVCNCTNFIDDEESSKQLVDTNVKIVVSQLQSIIYYAPIINPTIINGTLYGIIICWIDKLPGGNVGFMTNSVVDTYKKISSGYVKFRPFARTIKVNYSASAKNVAKAEQSAIDQILKMDGNKQKGPNDYFLIVNGCTKVNHTSINSHICHLTSTLITTANHENGHSLGLLHSNILDKGKVQPSLDGTSFMSIYTSANLTASQTYYMGWLNQMTALYDPTLYDPTSIAVFQIYQFNGPYTTGLLKAVILPGTNGYIFLSYPKFKDGFHLVLHTTYDKTNLGSLRVAVFGNQTVYDIFTITKLSQDDNSITVQVSKTS